MSRLKVTTPLKEWEKIKLEKGEWLGTYPLGYKVIPAKVKSKYNNNGEVVLDDKEVAIVKDMFKTYAAGNKSLDDMFVYILTKYGKIYSRSNMANQLKNEFYIGTMTWKGQRYPHKYPTFISKEIFYDAQEARAYNCKYMLNKGEGSLEYFKDKRKKDAPIKQMVTNHELYDLLIEQKDFETLLKAGEISLKELQNKLVELEMQGLIEECGPNVWRNK